MIAARSAMDLGATYLVNREHALIYSAGDLRIGGALDPAGRAVGQAVSLQNASATIEAAGNATISAATLLNQNNRYASETVVVSSKPKVYFTPEGTTDMYDAETNWLCDEVTPMCSKDPAWLDDDPERKLLLPSTKYPADRYGPPFNYAPGFRDKSGKNVPIPLTYIPARSGCGGAMRAATAGPNPSNSDMPTMRVWTVFGVTPPSGPMPVGSSPSVLATSTGNARPAKLRAVRPMKTPMPRTRPGTWNWTRIREFNSDYGSRLRGTLTYYQVNETVTETRTLSTDPGKILSGGSMTLTGTVTNDKSQIAAGALSVVGPNINNIGAGGERIITRVGTATVTQERSKGRKEYPATTTSPWPANR